METLEDRLAGFADVLSSWEDFEQPRVSFEAYLRDRVEADALAAQLTALLADLLTDGRVVLDEQCVPDCDWQAEWKRFFHVERVGERIVIKPSWEPYTPRGNDCVIHMDPGMAFGTGLHPTTRSCLRMIEALAPAHAGALFLDLGCGSGILSIAAVQLGFGSAIALDNDAQAVQATHANAAANGVGDRVDCTQNVVGAGSAVPRCPVVAANILANILVENAAAIAACLDGGPTARLILSGILADQRREVIRAYGRHALRVRETMRDGEWVSLLFERR